jgi:DNA-binding transcriptional MerR regulator
MRNGVTIGQAAVFAGVTVKTVRHYHKLGLVAEPERDSSGYRRYGSAELLRLVQVRTLAGAGVPLAEIGPLLDADGNRALLPDRAVALLARMPGLGFTTDEVAAAREGLVLAKALVPEGFDDHLTNIENALQDARFVALSKRAAAAAAWELDDPRIAQLATDMAEHYLANPAHLKIVTGLQARTEAATRYKLIRDYGADQGSAGARLATLVETKLRSAGVHIPRPDSY